MSTTDSSSDGDIGQQLIKECNSYSTAELARELNQLQYKVDKIPSYKDVREYGRYSKHQYQNRFESPDEALRLSNIKPPYEWVIEALIDFASSATGTSRYGTARNLRRFMYPEGCLKTHGALFGVEKQYLSTTDEREIIDSWEYPRISGTVVGQTLMNIVTGDLQPDGVGVSLWSESGTTNTYFIEVIE